MEVMRKDGSDEEERKKAMFSPQKSTVQYTQTNQPQPWLSLQIIPTLPESSASTLLHVQGTAAFLGSHPSKDNTTAPRAHLPASFPS